MTLTKGQNGTSRPAAPVTPVRGRLLKARGAAEYLGVKESRVRTLIATGDLVAVRNARGRLEGVYERDCDAWIAKRLHEPVPVTPRPSVDARVAQLLPADRRFA
jgi:hypothetical protein